MSQAITGIPAMSDVERAWEAWLKTAGWSITDIKGTFAAGYRAGNSPAVPGEVERMQDKIEGLEADLENAVEVAFKRGATEWTRLNYPDRYASLSATVPLPEIEGGDKGDGGRRE